MRRPWSHKQGRRDSFTSENLTGMAKNNRAKELVVFEGDDLGALYRKLIDDSGQTRYAISQSSGIPQASLSRCYNGLTAVTYEAFKKVAEALGYSVNVQVRKSD